ncbi:hypothetical protein [Sneathiella chungangensis]|uniref:hypothetical protein n=1 Tax=Sneathiella chungangensis TaxID=1418234 RepID=UPI0013682549|nr:hypothetical protein [Sneathiella chungangensis]
MAGILFLTRDAALATAILWHALAIPALALKLFRTYIHGNKRNVLTPGDRLGA